MEPYDYLSKNDPILKRLIDAFGVFPKTKVREPFDGLVKSIIGQQLSAIASNTICKRLEDLHGQRPFKSNIIKSLSHTELRSCGISNSKVKTILGITTACQNGELNKNKLKKLTDLEVREQLLNYWGVGEWTVNMFLIFTLERQDILVTNDAGLNRAHKILYPTHKSFTYTANKWRPYRTIASKYLWKFIDNPEIANGLISKKY